MKRLVLFLLTFSCLSSCKKYLDQVPANIANLDDAFKTISAANNFLASCYYYIPAINYPMYNYAPTSTTPEAWGSDEVAIPWTRTFYYSQYLVKGQQSAASPLYDYWGNSGLYDGVRQCYVFLDNIDKTPISDINGVSGSADSIRNEMKGEAYFLIGYYHFILLRQYGPIVIMDKAVENPSTYTDYPARAPYDSCVNFVSNILDKAVSLMPLPQGSQYSSSSQYGRVTALTAKSIKSRLLLYAASPLFNGNSEYYSNFKNKDGQLLISQDYDNDKWQKASDAAYAAIQSAEQSGISLVDTHNGSDDFENAIYNTRLSAVDPWNKELIWGYSAGAASWYDGAYGYQRSAMPDVDGSGTTYNGVAATLAMAELFYTKNGLPINVDPDFSYTNRYNYDATGLFLHKNREPRFYADIAYNQGLFYCNATTVTMDFLSGSNVGWSSGKNNYSLTGYLAQKMVNPNSIAISSNTNGIVSYPWPIMRLGELYLNYAEALNEAQGTSAQNTVITYLDKIRHRAGIPGVKESWSLIGKTSFSKEEMREIIRTERMIELAFEGHRVWDIRRWKLGEKYFNVPIKGMNIQGTSLSAFYQISNSESRSFVTPKSYLFPISTVEISKNNNLVQNPGY